MSTADPSDVRGVIDTSLSDSEITSFLEDSEFEASQAIDDYDTVLSTAEKRQLEKYLAAMFIRQFKEKGLTSQSGPARSESYEDTMSLSQLQSAVSTRDPSGTLATSVIRDSSRYVGSVGSE